MTSRFLILSALATLVVGGTVRQAAAEDLPDRIGRLNVVSGAVAFQLQDQPSWNEADFNYPVYTGMKVATDVKGRAEIGVGPDALRLASDTEVDMVTMSPRLLDIVVVRGHVHLSLYQFDTRENVEIELSAGSVWPLQTGGYAAELGAEDQPSTVAVLDGKASVLGSNEQLPVEAGQRAIVEGDTKVSLISSSQGVAPDQARPPAQASPPARAPDDAKGRPDGEHTRPPLPSKPASSDSDDEFIQWAVDRDTLPDTNVPPNLARDSSGYQMLDEYGEWKPSDTYGDVWYPGEVPPNWAPYRYGHWVSMPPWGPTWVDDQPWGFVPFHYGRWLMIDGQWGWVPGDPGEPEVYAPALVAFIGSPDQPLVDDSGSPAVGWVPLGPDEPYYPWYDADVVYVRRINAGHVHDFRHLSDRRIEEMRHAAAARALANRGFATVVSRATFAGARPTGGAMVRVAAERLARAPLMGGAPHLNGGEGQRVLHAENGRSGDPPGAGRAGESPFHPAGVPASSGIRAAPRTIRPGAGAGGWHQRREWREANPANREYRPPAGQQFSHPGMSGQSVHPGSPGQFGRSGFSQPQSRPAQVVQQGGIGGVGHGFQMPGRAMPMVRAPARAAPSGGAHHK